MVTSAGRPPAVGGVRRGLQGLRHVTAADRSLVAVPMLAPHLRFGILPGDGVLLASEETTVELKGRCFGDLLPLLDGSRTRQAIVAELEGRHPPVEVQTALVRLASAGFAVSAEFDMAPEVAAFWSALGASPRHAQERLAAIPVEVGGAGHGALAARLAGFGAVVVTGAAANAPALRVVVTGDYLSERHAAFHAGGANAVPWVLIRPTGVRALFGPVFGPDGSCWRCLARRMSATRQVHSLLRAQAADSSAGSDAPEVAGEPLAAMVYGLAAVEIAKWIVLGDEAPIHNRVMSFDAATSRTGLHHVPRWPRCSDCGAGEDLAPTPAPLRLAPSPKTLRNSGGTRSVHPEATLRRFGHLIDPVTGVVTDLERAGDPDDPWFFLYRAGFAPPLPPSSYEELRRAIEHGGSGGKGSTPAQAEASALCEAIERYSGILQGGETVLRRRMADFPDGEALHPNAIELFSAGQFERAPALGGRRPPVRFDASQALDWTPVWSFTADAWRYVPTRLLYYAPRARGEVNQFDANSNGCASGNTLEEAILQGFFELVERDAFACWWYNRIRMPAVDLASFGSPYLAEASARYERLGRELWMLDVTHDLGIPVFVAISRCASGAEERIICGAGCHFDPLVAAMRAVCELNQMHLGWNDDPPEPNGDTRWQVTREWLRGAKLADRPHLAPDPDAPPRAAPARRAPDTGDHRDDITLCRRIVEDAGMEFLVLDQTRSDVGLPVARVLVPGLRHFWARFAPGRLYDVPVAMGWRAAPLPETALNPEEPIF